MAALYRILFGHDQCQLVAKLKILGAERVMIGKTVGYGIKTQSAQTVKEALRIADTGQRMDTPGATPARRSQPLRALEGAERAGHQVHDMGTCRTKSPLTVNHNKIDRRHALRWLAQRPFRQTAPIAKAPLAVQHQNFDTSPQTVMLQAIVADNQVTVGLLQQVLSLEVFL